MATEAEQIRQAIYLGVLDAFKGDQSERKIVQIAAAGAGGDSNADIELYALCNDGTVWVQLYDFKVKGTYWKQLEPIPQPESKDGE